MKRKLAVGLLLTVQADYSTATFLNEALILQKCMASHLCYC